MEGCFHLFVYSGNVCSDADSHRKWFTEFIPPHGKPGKIRIKMKKISEKILLGIQKMLTFLNEKSMIRKIKRAMSVKRTLPVAMGK